MTVSAASAVYNRGQYPDEHMHIRYGPVAAAALANGSFLMGVLDRGGDIESITVRQDGTAATAGTITFKIAATGTAIGSGTAISAAETASQLTAGSAFQVPMAQSGSPHLNLAAGTGIGFTTASSIDNVSNLVIDVRIRTPWVRTTTAGDKQWFTNVT